MLLDFNFVCVFCISFFSYFFLYLRPKKRNPEFEEPKKVIVQFTDQKISFAQILDAKSNLSTPILDIPEYPLGLKLSEIAACLQRTLGEIGSLITNDARPSNSNRCEVFRILCLIGDTLMQ